MDINKKLFKDLDLCNSLQSFLDRVDFLITNEYGVDHTDAESGGLLDKDFLKEVQDFCQPQTSLYFGKTLRDLKCVITDSNFREHVIWIQYIGPKRFRIKDMDLPHSHLQDSIYKSIDEVVNVLKKHVDDLSNYFEELIRIDQCCIVMEPIRPTFKDAYRKIQLADKIWLHVEVSSDGSAKNLSVLGQFDKRVLQELLQAWDHNKDIATNVLTISSSLDCDNHLGKDQQVTVPECAICFCVELPGDARVPQPLCNNSKCGAYFHRSCLYGWLVAFAGGRTPQFGIGKCPSCSHHIQCSDRDI